MMKIAATQLIDDLQEMVRADMASVKAMETLPLAILNRKEDLEVWSVLENLEHLNLYGDFYLPALTEGIEKGKSYKANPTFRSNWLGEYFAKSMLPKTDGSIQKMKTFKSKNPKNGNLPLSVMDRFIKQQERLLELLEAARGVNMTKARTSTTIGKWVRIRLGDTFRVVVYHNRRHIMQIAKLDLK